MTADTDNPLVMEVLTASSTAYSYYPDVKISEVCKVFIVLSFRNRFGWKQARPLSHLIIINNIRRKWRLGAQENKPNTCLQPQAHDVHVRLYTVLIALDCVLSCASFTFHRMVGYLLSIFIVVL